MSKKKSTCCNAEIVTRLGFESWYPACSECGEEQVGHWRDEA